MSDSIRDLPQWQCRGETPGRLWSPLSLGAGKPVLPRGVYTGKRGPLPLHIAFSAWSLPSVSPHNDFFCYINLTHCGEPRRWDPGLLNCVKGKAPAPAFIGSQGCCGVGVPAGGWEGVSGWS